MRHPTQQRDAYRQEGFVIGLLTPGTGVNILSLLEGEVKTCLRALAARRIPIMSEMPHGFDASSPGSHSMMQLRRPLLWPPNRSAITLCQKRIVSDSISSSRLLAGRFLHWPAYTWHWRIDIIAICRRQNMYPCTASRVNSKLWTNWFMYLMTVTNRMPPNQQFNQSSALWFWKISMNPV